MRRNIKLPTILGIFILLISIVAGIYLINSKQVFKLAADVEALPKNVRVSNITDSSVTITWTTDIESSGFVKWGKSELSLSKIAQEEGTEKNTVHSASLMGAEVAEDIFFKINSNGNDYNNGGIPWRAKTAPGKIQQKSNRIASGTVLKSDGFTPAKSIVYLSINGLVLSALTSDEGNYVIPISIYTDNIPDNTLIEMSLQGGVLGTSQAVIYPQTIKSVPTIILGKTYDFRSLPPTDDTSLPESNLSIPESVKISSRFEITKTETPVNNTVKLESIDEGEIITTTDPEFFGTGPQNTNIEVLVESELQEIELTTDSQGKWNWSPPNNLEPGEHKVTLKWRDSVGILRTISRNFIIQAAEGPAFESTPSATLTPNPSATPTSKPLATTTSSATAPPVPETGSLTPTMGLFIMGIGILMSSVFVWNKSNA